MLVAIVLAGALVATGTAGGDGPGASAGAATGGVSTAAAESLLPAAEAKAKPRPRAPRRTRVLQLNLCLSGLAPCFRATRYPQIVRETVRTITRLRPDAVMINEACTKDLERIARRTGMTLTYSTIIWADKRPLACFDSQRRPVSRKRGHFGNAVLTRAAAVPGRDAAYTSQDLRSSDRRRIGCARTATTTFCATHLETRATSTGEAANDAQCTLLRTMTRRSASQRFTVVAGDVNRRQTCQPASTWHVATDSASRKRPGIQHVYADPRLGSRMRATLVPMSLSDHDGLLVTVSR